MNAALTTLTTILGLIPSLITAIKAIEEAIPGQGQGEAKLTAIRKILEITDAGIAALWPTLAKVIGVVVDLFNKTGTFTTSKE